LRTFNPLQPPQFAKLRLYGVRKRLSSREKDYLVEEGDIKNISVREIDDAYKLKESADDPFFLQLALYTDKGLSYHRRLIQLLNRL
jgi:hypothetical protein